jgi:hypothetical protein
MALAALLSLALAGCPGSAPAVATNTVAAAPCAVAEARSHSTGEWMKSSAPLGAANGASAALFSTGDAPASDALHAGEGGPAPTSRDLPPGATPASEGAARSPAGPPRVSGPFRIGSPGNALELGFAAQLRFNLAGMTATPATANVEVRRLRFNLRGALLDERLRFLVQLNATPAALELVDLWADWRFTGSVHLRVGQFKTPFTRYRQQSFTSLALADWPVFAAHFGAERQVGVMLHDGGGQDAHWVYQAGVFTGVNARASFARGLAAMYGETVANPSDLRTFHPPTELHPALIARVGHESAGVRSAVSSDGTGGGLRHAVHVSAAWDVRPSYPVDFPLRLAPEALFKWNHLFVDVVAAAGFFVDGGGAWGLASVGENVEAGWRFSPPWEIAARFSRVDSTDAVRADAKARAVARVAAAPPEEHDAVAARFAKAGTPRWTQEAGAALNAYLVGDGLKWQTDVTWIRTDGPPHDEVRLRKQLQLAF